MVQKGVFWPIGEHLYFVYFPIISYQRMKAYRVETMDIGQISLNHWCQWNMQMQLSQ